MKPAHFSLKAFYTLCPPLCLVNRFSVFRFLLLFFVFSGLGEVKGQNVINIYQDFTGAIDDWIPADPYDGEYIMDIHSVAVVGGVNNNAVTNPPERPHLMENIWYTDTKCYSRPRQLSAAVELVSFPFWADTTNTDMDSSSNRILTVLNDDELKEIQYTRRNVLSSVLFGRFDILGENRNYIPHSIFRHKLYIYCGRQAPQEPLTDPLNPPTPTPNPPSEATLDSLVFTVDLTRSQMRFYPFRAENNVDLQQADYDIILHPFFMLNDDYTATNNDLDEINYYDLTDINIDLCEEFPCSENTINYFPAEDVTDFDICDAVDCLYPENPSANLNPIEYIHPSPFSLAGFLMQGDRRANPAGYRQSDTDPNILERRPGIEHTYIIDQNINLNLINSNEKIIYNPSEVHIEADNLVFPSGYTFKTARGLYPTVNEVNNTTICDAADELDDPRLIHVPTDLQNTVNFTTSEGIALTAPAFYVLEPGSKLTIEPCVSLFDVTFVVRLGAELIFHPNQTYGNFQIVEEAADVTNDPEKVIEVLLPNKTCNDCRCVQEYNINQDLIINDGETVVWSTEQTVRGSVTVRNGGELQILATKVEFADASVTDGALFTGIKVEAGGKLKLNHADLTILDGDQINNCANRHQSWGGIMLQGINPQAVGEHAVLEAVNSSISYAERAIYAEGFVYDDFGQTNWQCGGKVSGTNITFKNNRVAYCAIGENPNNGFTGCTFTLGTAHPSRASTLLDDFVSHVLIVNQQDLRFSNCVFKNDLSIIEEPQFASRETLLKLPFIEDRGIGILAYESDFEVFTKDPPYAYPAPMNDKSAFEGLYRGIESHSFGVTSMDIRGTEFKNTLQCITTSGNSGDIITDQNVFTFDITPFFEDSERPDDDVPPADFDAWAIYSFGSNEYEISDNIIYFKDFPAPESSGNQAPKFIEPNYYGIIVNNTAGGSGMVNGNEFVVDSTGFLVQNPVTGTQTEENNQFIEIGCNTYNNFDGKQEWLVNPISPTDNPNFTNILNDQGSGCGSDPQTGNPLPAGNLFGNNCGGEANIRVGFLETPFEYWANGLPGSEPYPDCSSTNGIDIQECEGADILNQEEICPVGNSGSGGIGKAMVNSSSPTGIATELNNGNYDETEKTLLTTAVYKIYEEAEQESDAIVFLEAMDTKHSNSVLMKKYLHKGLFLEAQNKLNTLHGGSVYDASYLQFYQLLIDVKVSGRKYTELTTTELQTVENIAQANTYGSVYAESLLAMLNQTTIDRVPHKESTQSNKSTAVNELNAMVQIYPNPMNNTVTIESAVESAKLNVYNITGQFMEQRDLVEGKNDLEMNFPNGTYFFQIQSEQQMITHKVVIAQ